MNVTRASCSINFKPLTKLVEDYSNSFPLTTNFHRDRLIQGLASFVPLLCLVSILIINSLTSFLACCQSIMGAGHSSDTAVTKHDERDTIASDPPATIHGYSLRNTPQRSTRKREAEAESKERAVSNAMRVSPLPGSTYTACF